MANKPITPEEMKAYVDATWEKCQAEAWQEPRQWQGLTGQEIKDCEKQAMVNGSLPFEQRSFFARAIEAKIREKNK